jgi:hypothetical protein
MMDANDKERRISELQVAEQEVQSCSSSVVYVQLSPRAVALPMDRTVVQARVSRKLNRLLALRSTADAAVTAAPTAATTEPPQKQGGGLEDDGSSS